MPIFSHVTQYTRVKLQLPQSLKRQVIHICEDYPCHLIFLMAGMMLKI